MIKSIPIITLLACISCKQYPGKVFVPAPANGEKLVIALQPFQGSRNLTMALRDSLAKKMNAEFIVLDEIELPASSYYQPRNRYLAASLLDFLRDRNEVYSKVIGVTQKDISVQKGHIKNWGVMGFGFCPGESCVISSFRIMPSSLNQLVFRKRMFRLALHELGHTFGLPHCENKKCVMRDANGKMPFDECADYCVTCRSHLTAAGILGECPDTTP